MIGEGGRLWMRRINYEGTDSRDHAYARFSRF